jgi:hypothetical protein
MGRAKFRVGGATFENLGQRGNLIRSDETRSGVFFCVVHKTLVNGLLPLALTLGVDHARRQNL